MRIILFTGKGGVGKTTIAASTALKIAATGKKTLVISTDPAHSLADALDVKLGPEPVEIRPNLYGQEFDVYYSMKKYWGNIRDLMMTVMKWQGIKNVVAEELSALPGMEEASAFLWLEDYYQNKSYDVIVIDSAPTGETLTLLSLPQVMQSWMLKGFPLQKYAIKGFGSFMRTMTGIPLDKGYEELEVLFKKLETIQEVFLNPEICTMRIVANPERMVIQEAKRAYTYLQLYGYHVDALIVNRILPEALSEGYLKQYLVSQKTHLQEIEDNFAPLPILRTLHLGKEIFGIPLLEEIGNALYQGHHPAEVLYRDEPMKIRETAKGFELDLKLPFITGSEISVNKYGDELVIDLGNRRKSFILPRFSHYLQLESHRFETPWLTVCLSK